MGHHLLFSRIHPPPPASCRVLQNSVVGCRVVVTNPSSSQQSVDVLLQIPTGALAVRGGYQTKSRQLVVGSYGSQVLEYFFYFPECGTYTMSPAQAAKGAVACGRAQPLALEVRVATVARDGGPDRRRTSPKSSPAAQVVKELAVVDETSWKSVVASNDKKKIVKFLREMSLFGVDVPRIAFLLRDKPFYVEVVSALRSRMVYDRTVWSFSFSHDDVEGMKEFLARHAGGRFGPCVASTLLSTPAAASYQVWLWAAGLPSFFGRDLLVCCATPRLP